MTFIVALIRPFAINWTVNNQTLLLVWGEGWTAGNVLTIYDKILYLLTLKTMQVCSNTGSKRCVLDNLATQNYVFTDLTAGSCHNPDNV